MICWCGSQGPIHDRIRVPGHSVRSVLGLSLVELLGGLGKALELKLASDAGGQKFEMGWLTPLLAVFVMAVIAVKSERISIVLLVLLIARYLVAYLA